MKKILILLLLFSLTGCSSNIGAKKAFDFEGKDKPLKLKASKDKILDSKEYNNVVCSDILHPNTCINKGKVKKYLYISDKKAPKETLDIDGQK